MRKRTKIEIIFSAHNFCVAATVAMMVVARYTLHTPQNRMRRRDGIGCSLFWNSPAIYIHISVGGATSSDHRVCIIICHRGSVALAIIQHLLHASLSEMHSARTTHFKNNNNNNRLLPYPRGDCQDKTHTRNGRIRMGSDRAHAVIYGIWQLQFRLRTHFGDSGTVHLAVMAAAAAASLFGATVANK